LSRFITFIGMAAACAGFVLAGCAAPRTAESDAAIHKVVIVTALDESGVVNRIGLTVFNNDTTTLPQGGAISRTAVDTITRRLHQARPAWEIVPAGVDLVALGVKDNAPNTLNSSSDALQADVASIVRNTGADAVFVVYDAFPTNSYAPGAGVGAALRKLPGIDAHVIARAHVYLSMQDRTGHQISGWSGAESPLIKAADLGMTDELASAHTAEASAKLSEAMRMELQRDLEAALQRMGY
jgi:hypothetical protein